MNLQSFACQIRADLAFGGDSEFSAIAVMAMDEALESGAEIDLQGALRCARHCYQVSVSAGGAGADMIALIDEALS